MLEIRNTIFVAQDIQICPLEMAPLLNYWPPNFENDSTPVLLELGPSGSSGSRDGAGQQTFSRDL